MTPSMAPRFPLRHISIRVPWHDSGWAGTICKAPKLNGACLKLKRIGQMKNEDQEDQLAGRSIQDLDQSQWPCCVVERAMFMAPFEYTRNTAHPYAESSPETHGHLALTPLRHPQFSAPALPFRWMLSESLDEYAQTYGLSLDQEFEPRLPFRTSWVQDLRNQKPLLDCFFDHLRPNESLCFFYAKQIPFVEKSGRVIVGVGRVKHVGSATEYVHTRKGDLRCLLWERMVQHTIRPGYADGFLLPYHEAMELAAHDPNFDPAEIAAFAPDDRMLEFSYASEHVTHDGAIASLLACAASLEKTRQCLQGPWDACLKWIDARLTELWKMRGPCPGLGPALCAFGVDLGTLVAREIAAKVGDNENPWQLVDKMFKDPRAHLSEQLASRIGSTIRETWKVLPKERLALLQLLSQLEISPEQAKTIYVREEREEAGIETRDKDILENPYLMYELTQLTHEPISVWTADRGVFPEPVVREKHPLPAPTALDSGTDRRRVRALTMNVLEGAASDGHTLLSQKDVILHIRDLPIEPDCEVNSDMLTVAEKIYPGIIEIAELDDGSRAYQLKRLTEVGDVIRSVVTKRMGGRRHEVTQDWLSLLDRKLGTIGTDEAEERARTEKAAALKELAESRVSVLIGPAGTGKTTLLSILCGQAEVAAGGVLLLAPTGKARVRMADAAKQLNLKAYTLAQFLSSRDRYDVSTQRYRLSQEAPEDVAKTVIVDEASMLTEEMLGALLDALKGLHRLILVGDPRQLPPIGAGRPFVDIVTKLSPKNASSIFPRVGPGYAELTVRRRQMGQDREDLRLAEWFSGNSVEPGEDDIFDSVVRVGSSEHVRFEEWQSPEECHNRILEVLVKELRLQGPGDIRGFDLKLGGTASGNYTYFNLSAAEKAEAWQILSPVRGLAHGVSEINRFVHRIFRSEMVTFARQKYRKIPKPMGNELIVYGDKVINVRNHSRSGKKVYPQEGAAGYLANGEIGMVVGQFKSANMSKPPWILKFASASQPKHQYDFYEGEFGEESDPCLELAYALTVHKAQGSEFGLVLLVLPSPCRLLSRELLYTALTRQRDRVVIIHQGSRSDLKKYASDGYSEIARRFTNLFEKPKPRKVGDRFLEERLIHCACDGTLVRSKSEVIIYDRLLNKGLKPSYEKELRFGATVRFPDFTIEDEDSGEVFYWEHCGMLQDPAYAARWKEKLKWYRENGILPYQEGNGKRGTLIETRDTPAGGISSQEINSVIDRVILERSG